MTEQIAIKKPNPFLLFIGTILFFSIVFAPFEVLPLKVACITILVVAGLTRMAILKSLYLSKKVLIWLLILIVHGVFFTVYGYLRPENNTDYVLRSASVNILWPVLYGILITLLNNFYTFKRLIQISLLALAAIGIYLLLAGLAFMQLIPLSIDAFGMAKPVIGKYEASVQLFLAATTSLLFLIPFFISCLLLNINKTVGIKNYQVIIAIILGLVATIITARRALILNILISPIFIFLLLKATKIRLSATMKKRIFFTFLLFVIIAVLALFLMVQFELFDVNAFLDLFIAGFDFNSAGQDEGSSVRGSQLWFLVDSWLEHPILGTGHGSVSKYIIRSDVTPWIYELSYMALLFQTGIVGIIVYMGLLLWVVYRGITLVKQNKENIYLLPALVGYICFLIGNASNPYMVAYDHMWALFLPICFINYSLISKKYK